MLRKRILVLFVIAALLLAALSGGAAAADGGGLERFSRHKLFSSLTFKDVNAEDWFFGNVQSAYEYGLMIGDSTDTFNPNGFVTLAETVTVAARLCSIYHTGGESFSQGQPWYQAYVDYAKFSGILSADYPDYSKTATRAEYAQILAAALPPEALAAVNQVTDGAIPDVPMRESYAAAVYKLYRAGVLIGNDALGTFAPASNIRRCEVAAIVSRMANAGLRQAVSLGGQCTVTFIDGSSVSSQSVAPGGLAQEPPAPEQEGWRFRGWYTQPEGGEKFRFITPVSQDITLYAQWRQLDKDSGSSRPPKSECTVTFVANGDNVENLPAPQIVAINAYAAAPAEPSRAGYAFIGWYAQAPTPLNRVTTQSRTLYSFLASPVTDDLTLYAWWVDTETVTDTDGDGLTDPVEKDLYGTDPQRADTDGDGLSDYIEIVILGLDPLQPDSDGNGIADGEEDADGDGLSNREEVLLGTDPCLSDTDGDGLSDQAEVRTYATDPRQADSDGDGVSDGKEIELGTDPLVYQTVFSVTLTPTASDGSLAPTVLAQLSGSQVETLQARPVTDETLFPPTMPGYTGCAWDFQAAGSGVQAELRFPFDPALAASGEFQPVIYYYNEESKTLEPLATTVEGHTAIARVSHFSTYILLNRLEHEAAFTWEEVWDDQGFSQVEIVLVIDDSGSMASNDPANNRLTVANALIGRLPEGSKIGIVRFEDNSDRLTATLTDSQALAQSCLSGAYFRSSGGSSMYAGINSALGLFASTDTDTLRMIVVLSDGAATDTDSHSSAIAAALSRGVKIYTVGLGSSTSYFNNYLAPLAQATGGGFYLAGNAANLTAIYEDINKKIDIETDSDQDGLPDYYEENLTLFNGVTLHTDKDAVDSDGDGLADGQEIRLSFRYNADKSRVLVTGQVFSDPTKVDSDGDGIKDADDKHPLDWDVCDRDLAMLAALSYQNATVGSFYQAAAVNQSNLWLNLASLEELIGAAAADDEESLAARWTVVNHTSQLTGLLSRFSATTYSNGHNIVIAFRGTDDTLEWVDNLLCYGAGNYHSEEGLARQYALFIYRAFVSGDPEAKLYITGHSLGGYLAQIATAQLVSSGCSDRLTRVAYFNGIGMKYNKLLFWQKNDEIAALRAYASGGNLVSYTIKGDVVSMLGSHYGRQISYPAAPAMLSAHAGRHGVTVSFWDKLREDTIGIALGGALLFDSRQNIAEVDKYYSDYQVQSHPEYLTVTHSLASFFLYLPRG